MGGVIPTRDIPELLDMGIKKIMETDEVTMPTVYMAPRYFVWVTDINKIR